MKITVETKIDAPIAVVWDAWNTPADVCAWNAASDDWHTPTSDVDLREGGSFCHRMEAGDGSAGFDFRGTYTRIVPQERIEFSLKDGRVVTVEFESLPDGARVRETFGAESELAAEQQRQGWQAILDRFAKHVEAKSA